MRPTAYPLQRRLYSAFLILGAVVLLAGLVAGLNQIWDELQAMIRDGFSWGQIYNLVANPVMDVLPGLGLIAAATIALMIADIADTVRRNHDSVHTASYLGSRRTAVDPEPLTDQQEQIARRIAEDLARIVNK